MYFVCEFGLSLVELKKWQLRNEVADEFLDLPRHILEFATTENHNKREISVVGRSGCGRSLNMKIKARPGCTRIKGCSSARETNKNKKVTSKQEQGLNFTVNVDFWFCNDHG